MQKYEYIRMLKRDKDGNPVVHNREFCYELTKIEQKKYCADEINDRGAMKFTNALLTHMVTQIPVKKIDRLYNENKNIKLYQRRINFARNNKIIDGFCDAAGYDEKKIRQGIISFCENEIQNLLKRRNFIMKKYNQ